MKKRNSKSILGLLLMGFCLIAFSSTDAYAQKQRKQNRTQNAKVLSPVKHYSKQPRLSSKVSKLSRKHVEISHRNLNYRYKDGIFYRPANGSYIVSVPPIGIRVSVLPSNPFRLNNFKRPYYYYYGTYYVALPTGGYEVVGAPVGARVDALPDGYEIVELDSMVYYRLDKTYYKAVVEPNGNVVYEVVRV